MSTNELGDGGSNVPAQKIKIKDRTVMFKFEVLTTAGTLNGLEKTTV